MVDSRSKPSHLRSPGSRFLVSLESGTTVAFDTEAWEIGQIITPEDAGRSKVATFSRDGTVLVTRAPDGTIAVHDPDSFRSLATLTASTL